MELHSIQSDLNGITEYNSAIIDPNERQRTIIGDLKVIQKEISSLIETRSYKIFRMYFMTDQCPC